MVLDIFYMTVSKLYLLLINLVYTTESKPENAADAMDIRITPVQMSLSVLLSPFVQPRGKTFHHIHVFE